MKSWTLLGSVAIWIGGVVAGFVAWEWYDATPGQSAATPTRRPPSGYEWEVVAFVHPHCPCTRATIAALGEIARGTRPGVAFRVVFVLPPDATPGWERGRNWAAAAELGSVDLSCDFDGGEAGRAGATSSGDVVVYDAGGGVAFRGGITPARGRGGDCPGRRAVIALLTSTEPHTREAAVYGCSLFGRSRCVPADESETPCRR